MKIAFERENTLLVEWTRFFFVFSGLVLFEKQSFLIRRFDCFSVDVSKKIECLTLASSSRFIKRFLEQVLLGCQMGIFICDKL